MFYKIQIQYLWIITAHKTAKIMFKKKKRFSIFKFEAWRFTKLCLFQIRALMFYEMFSLEIPCTY